MHFTEFNIIKYAMTKYHCFWKNLLTLREKLLVEKLSTSATVAKRNVIELNLIVYFLGEANIINSGS